MTPHPAPDPDLVIAFRATKAQGGGSSSKQDAVKAEQQYRRLVDTLRLAGLQAVGRRGEGLGHLVVFVRCPEGVVEGLVRRERQADFLSNLPVTPLSASAPAPPLSPADRIRLVHTFVASTPQDGGLGISPSQEWDLVESILPLHDRKFNEAWVRSWTPGRVLRAEVQLEKIREQYGDALALYFAFLSAYTRFLVFPSILGLIAAYLLPPYSPVYSALLSLWAVFFVEWWRVHERILGLRFGVRGSDKVEHRRAQYKPNQPWWAQELKMLASVPVILLFAAVLVGILTAIFIFEAFVTQLYQGPGKAYISLAPTLLFVALVPQFMALYTALARRLTDWENHAHQSAYAASLTRKTFALSALVAYLGLGLSAFVYVPFGAGVMRQVQRALFRGAVEADSVGWRRWVSGALNATIGAVDNRVSPSPAVSRLEKKAEALAGQSAAANETLVHAARLFDMDTHADLRTKLNPRRLRDQMFAFTVTNQAVNTFVEVGLPYVLRAVRSFRAGKSKAKGEEEGTRKRVVFEDEKERGGMEERAFLDRVRQEVALPTYDLFADYSEMVVQFGYVVLWSSIWPLAGAMALLNNLLELRSDAFKMTVHSRRPLPARTDTIGPWLDALAFLSWLGALTNAALVYLFSPELLATTLSSTVTGIHPAQNTTLSAEEHLVGASAGGTWGEDGSSSVTLGATRELLGKAALVALVASHGFLIVRAVVRHVVERMWWQGSEEVRRREAEEREVRERFLGVSAASKDVGLGGDEKHVRVVADLKPGEMRKEGLEGFWEHDEGLEEIQRISKEA